jgi:dihydroneopterin aldolase/2-amino-4-hydroxy-6-hydroxymethyldihydropteridine diphosphokinase
MSDRIELSGLRARGYHGVYDDERRDGQDFVVDLVLHLPLLPAATTDDVVDTVHYGELAERVAVIVSGPPVDLLETLAQRIADEVLTDDRVDRVEVRVHKPQAPITVAFGDVSVAVERSAPHRAVIALGANLGDRAQTLRDAVTAIVALPAVSLLRYSSVVESVALTLAGVDESRPAYLNQVALIRTELEAEVLLDRLHGIEDAAGRVRGERWGDRTLDLDIVDFDGTSSSTAALELPHPRAAERAFVLVPWLEIDPGAVLPGRGRVDALVPELTDSVVVYEEPA